MSKQKGICDLECFNETLQCDCQSCVPIDLLGLGGGPFPRRNEDDGD